MIANTKDILLLFVTKWQLTTDFSNMKKKILELSIIYLLIKPYMLITVLSSFDFQKNFRCLNGF